MNSGIVEYKGTGQVASVNSWEDMDELFGKSVALKFVETHSAIFCGGTNLGQKLDTYRKTGLKIKFYYETKMLGIEWNNVIGFFPDSNAAIMISGNHAAPVSQITHPIVAGVSATAQVETPFGHVHAGLGAGKKGK